MYVDHLYTSDYKKLTYLLRNILPYADFLMTLITLIDTPTSNVNRIVYG